MSWFRCFIRGDNFPLELVERRRVVGFYTTRFVEAISAEEAEQMVLTALRDEPLLQVPPGTPGMESARLFIEEIEEVGEPGPPSAGFTFFDGDDD